jgi:hypothetical protein
MLFEENASWIRSAIHLAIPCNASCSILKYPLPYSKYYYNNNTGGGYAKEGSGHRVGAAKLPDSVDQIGDPIPQLPQRLPYALQKLSYTVKKLTDAPKKFCNFPKKICHC